MQLIFSGSLIRIITYADPKHCFKYCIGTHTLLKRVWRVLMWMNDYANARICETKF